MATKIVLEDWREGLKKISLTKLQVDLLGISINEAKKNVDLLLEGNKITIEIDNYSKAVIFVNQATILGANCKLLEFP